MKKVDKMRKVESKQKNVKFSYCSSPVTIDKSKDWGEGNFQNFPDGVYFKYSDDGTISHGVQPNSDNTAPEGWIRGEYMEKYHKKPIWIDEEITPAGVEIQLNTLDGIVNYRVKEDSIVCFNGDKKLNIKDCWLQTKKEVEKNYVL